MTGQSSRGFPHGKLRKHGLLRAGAVTPIEAFHGDALGMSDSGSLQDISDNIDVFLPYCRLSRSGISTPAPARIFSWSFRKPKLVAGAWGIFAIGL